MVLIPDIIIANTCNKVLSIIRQNHLDAIDNGQEDRSLLYLLFSGNALGKYDLYENAKQLLITTPESPLHLEVRVGYDHTPATQGASIYIAMSSESDKNNSLQIGEGDQDELVFENDEGQNEYIKQYRRRYLTTSQVFFITQNRNEVMVLYHLFKSILTACINHLALEGISNLKIGGQDIRLTSAVPERIFMKAITLTYEYDQVVPEVFIQDIFKKIRAIMSIDDTGFRDDAGPIVDDESL